jgi:hypothetical protein
MGKIDLEALRKKHEELNKKSGGGGNNDFIKNFYQVKDGSNNIRILPWKSEDKEFYAETKIHRIPMENNQVKNVHCRKVHDEKCPLCDLYYSLWKTGKKEDEALARQIKPRSRYYMNIMDRETADVKILSIGEILFKKIIAAMIDPDFGDITDPDKGHDFKIVKQMEGQWPRYDQSQPRPKSSPLGTKAEIAKVMETLHDIHALVKIEEYDAVKQIAETLAVGGMLKPSDSSSEEGSDEEGGGDYISKLRS